MIIFNTKCKQVNYTYNILHIMYIYIVLRVPHSAIFVQVNSTSIISQSNLCNFIVKSGCYLAQLIITDKINPNYPCLDFEISNMCACQTVCRLQPKQYSKSLHRIINYVSISWLGYSNIAGYQKLSRKRTLRMTGWYFHQ